MDNQLKKWAILVLASILLVPVIIYAGGSLLVGPYEGESGLLGMAGKIYGDALRLKGTAWLLLLAPVLLVGIWQACFWLQRRAHGN